jgi:integrase
MLRSRNPRREEPARVDAFKPDVALPRNRDLAKRQRCSTPLRSEVVAPCRPTGAHERLEQAVRLQEVVEPRSRHDGRGPAGLPTALRFHDLRHTCASILIAQGAHPKEIQARLGHASINTTMDRYGHLLPTLGAQLDANLEEVFRTARESA